MSTQLRHASAAKRGTSKPPHGLPGRLRNKSGSARAAIAPATRRSAWPALLVIGLGAAGAPLDFAVNVAFPAMTSAFGLSTEAIRWVAVCYVLTYGSLMLGFGALGDRIGHLRIFRAGLVLATAAFAFCALAPAYPWLLAARAVQGVSAALVLSCGPALATQLIDDSDRTWALSAYAGTAAVATLVAPLAGGLFLAWLGWPGVFWFRVPIALVALAGLPLLARSIRHRPASTAKPFDAAGNLLLASAMALILLGPAVPSVWPSVAGLLPVAAYAWRRSRGAAPFLPPEVAGRLGFWLVNAGAVIVQWTSFAVPLLLPYYMLGPAGWAPVASGAMLCVWAGGQLLGASMAPPLCTTHGAKRIAYVAAMLACASLATIATALPAPTVLRIGTSLLLQGLGLGLFQVAYSDVVVAALPVSARGVAGSLTMVTRTIGIVLGAASWISWLMILQDHAATTVQDARQASIDAFIDLYRTAAAVTAICLLAGMLFRLMRRREHTSDDE